MCRALGVVVGTSRPLPGYWITPVLRVLRTLCHPLQQSRFMSGGESTLNEIDSFYSFIYSFIDGWIYLSIHTIKKMDMDSKVAYPKSFLQEILLWTQEAKGMSSAASPPH